MPRFARLRLDVFIGHLPAMVAAAVGITLLSAASLLAEDWPTYRRDNDRSGSTPEKVNGSISLKWTYAPPAPPRRAWSEAGGRTMEGHIIKDRVRFDDAFQPVVVGQRVYFGSTADDQVHCLDLTTGKTLWSFFTGAPVRLAPTVHENAIYFGSDDGFAYSLDAETGALIWKLRAGPSDEWFLGRGQMVSRWPVRTGVLVDDGVAYFGAGIFPHEDVYLHAVDAKTGEVVWTRDDISESDAGRDDLSPQGYLLASKEQLFVPSGRSMPATFDRKDGVLLHKKTYSWRSTAGGVVGGTRALLADGQIYSGGAHHLLAIGQADGAVGFGWFEGRQMVVAGDEAAIATGTAIARIDRLKYAVNSQKTHKLEMDVYSLSRSLRSAKGDKADEARAKMKAAQALLKELSSVGVIWQKPNEDDAALLVTGDMIISGGNEIVQGYDRATGDQTLTLKVDGQARGLVFANGHLIVSTTTGHVFCFGSGEPKNDALAEAKKYPNPYAEHDQSKLLGDSAEQIIKETGITRGFCLVAGSEDGQLAYELATRTDLNIYCIEPDTEKARKSRELLNKAGLYGSRVTVHQAELSAIPYSNYFANLIVSDTYLRTGSLPGDARLIMRYLKPLGGVAWLSSPVPSKASPVEIGWLKEAGLAQEATIASAKSSTTLARGGLPGAGNWSHQYGNVGNTAVVDEKRVKGDLGVLWFGDPGPGDMVNRHEGAVGPLSVNGRLFVQGEATISAFDAYNGLFLWKYENEEAIRSGVFQNQNPGNLATSNDRLFNFLKDECFELDAATGKVVAVHRLPPEMDDDTREWGYVAYHNGRLIGTATVRADVEARYRRRGRKTTDSTDGIFAIDVKTGKHLWTYSGGSISHRTIALGGDEVFFIDSTITSEERDRILREDKSELERLTGEELKIAEDRMKKLDARTAVAVDAENGKKIWAVGVDVTDCSEIGIGGGKLTMMYQDGVLVLCGANANGHYWNQFMSGEFKRRRLVALSAEAGYTMWKKDANYRHRPIVVGNRVIAEPWSFELTTGEQHTKVHPLTGQDVPWSMIRPGHHCGMLTGCDSMLMFRSGYTGFYNLDNDEGTRHFAGHRLGCWINAIPANGLVMIPEASAGCVCQFSIASTIVLEPREARRPWTIISATGAQTPVKKMSLNLGAPGDRRAADGTLWLAYPRPNPHKVTSLDLAFDLKPVFTAGGFTSVNAAAQPVTGATTPWLYTSWASGLSEMTLPLRGEKDRPATYDLKLHFAQLREGTARFDVEINGKVVLSDVEVSRQRGAEPVAQIQAVSGIDVERNLTLKLVAKVTDDAKAKVVLNAIEVQQKDQVASSK
jgi:outer membrane protein assembly factor BamB